MKQPHITEPLSYAKLKEKHRALRDDFPQALALRTHRALSWLRRAEQEEGDEDARIIFPWIAFNAAYASEIPDRPRFSETSTVMHKYNKQH